MNIDQIVEQIKNNAEDVLNIPAKILNSYDRNGISLLSHTIEERNFNLFVSLINQGANTNDIVQDEKGFTALHQISCAEDFDDMTEYINCLKSKGHDFNIQDSEGKTALFYAIDYSNLSNVKALVDSGIDVNIKDNKKFTAIMYDAGYIEVLKVLLNAGADIDVISPISNRSVREIFLELDIDLKTL